MYIVAEGDTLSSIARKFYGNAAARRRILEANWRVIGDPFMMPPGLRLRIPH
jgi:nucleoid-associated protein YgaU